MSIRTAQKKGIDRVCAAVLALALVCVAWAGMPSARAETSGMVRVKLTRLGAPSALQVAADCEYYLDADPSVRIRTGETATISASGDGLTLTTGSGAVSLGRVAKLMRAGSGNEGIKFLQPELSNRFCGDLGLSATDGVISAILNIYIENYLYGAVGYAIAPSAGMEALRAQSVAARTYALRRHATRTDAAYDLADTGELTFKGYSDSEDYQNVIQAVDDTRGKALYFDGALAQCYSCASNGGQTESSKHAGGAGLEYSVVKDDPYDLESKTAVVRTGVVNKDLSGVENALHAALLDGAREAFHTDAFRLMGIESVTACESRFPAPSRLYRSLTFKLSVSGVEGTDSVSVSVPTYGAFEDWYDLSINAEDNETVWVTEDERAFSISFRRQGSGVGLSQRGAQVMAEQGMGMADILAFYYPGTELKDLALSEDTQEERNDGGNAVQGQIVANARLSAAAELLDIPEADGKAVAALAAGAVVDIYGVRDAWAAVGSGGKYGFMPIDSLESFSLPNSTLIRAEGDVWGHAAHDVELLQVPVTGAQSLGTVKAGEAVKVLAWTGDWRMVSYQSTTGFVEYSAVTLAETGNTPEPEEQQDPTAFVDAAAGVTAMLKQDAPLFETPNALSSSLLTLKKGDVVTVLAYSQEWVRVRTKGGQTGCLRLESVTAMENGGGKDDEIEGGPIKKVKGKKFMYVAAGSAPVYETWSTDSEVLKTLYYGKQVRIGAYNSLWACVRVDDLTGYVRWDALAGKKPAAIEGGSIVPADPAIMAVAKEDAAVYDSALSGARQLTSLTQGQRVSVDAYNAAWALIRVDGVTGYVRLRSLERVDN